MEPDVKSTKKILMSVADKLLAAQQEIDELTVQLALGKAEARDKFNEIKKDFREKVSELKAFLANIPSDLELSTIRTKIDELEMHLLQGEVNTREAFEAQKDNLMKATSALEKTLQRKVPFPAELQHFVHEIEKFKVKLEILRLKFSLKKMEVKNEFRIRMDEAKAYIDERRTLIKDKIDEGREKYEDFGDEIRLAYTHFRKALKELSS